MNGKLVKIIAIIAYLVGSFVSSAQTQIKGSVADGADGKPVLYCNCVLLKAQDSSFAYGATTDDKGKFVFKQVAKGDYLMRISYVGYDTFWQPVQVAGSASPLDLGKLSLKRASTVLDAVKVTAKKPLYAVDGEKNMYNTTEDPSIQNGTASDALQNAPGVEVDAEGNITLRGVSSVEIWINDRPSNMNAEALKQYIKQLPANAIDRIEVITNPSARYSTSGGVINIITNQKIKRNELLCIGVRGTTTPAVSPWVSYVWANEKVDLNLYLSGNYGMQKTYSDGTSTLLDDNGDTSRFQSFDNKTRMPYWGGYAGLNVNWRIDSMTNLMAWAGAYPYWDRNSFYNDYQYYEYNPTRVDLGYVDTTLNNGFSHGAYGGAWYEHRFDTTGRKVSVSINGSYYSNGGYSDDWRYYRSATLADFQRHLEASTYNVSGQLSVNYTHPFKGGFELETGGELGYGRYYENETLDSLLPLGDWSNMAYRSKVVQANIFTPAIYATVQKRWGGFTTKLGLRFEDAFGNATMEHHSVSDKMDAEESFPGLVPSIHLSYQTKTFESYSLSYTRRFSYSQDWADYTLFRNYSDYSFITGNPNLRNSFSHNLEANFNKYIMKFGNIGAKAYFRANTDERGMMTAATVDPVLGPYLVNYSYPVNIGSSHTEGLELSATYRPTGFFNIRFNASVWNYGYDYNGFSDSKVSYSARLNLWAKLWNKLEVFANAHYRSPSIALYSETVANRGFDFGVSSDFFDRRMSVYLNVNDIFGMAQWGENTTAPQYQTTGKQRFDSRFVSLGLTWRIGKMELESKARQGASETPMGRGQ